MKLKILFLTTLIACLVLLPIPAKGQAQGPVRITLDQAIEMALRHNHTLLATRTTVRQSQAQEISANLRPNPTFSTSLDYIPLTKPDGGLWPYLRDSAEADVGLDYTIERGNKRQHRLLAAKDATAVARAQVADAERALTFQVSTLFINAQLAQSALDLAQQNLTSFEGTVKISQSQFNAGGVSENDNLKIKLQLLQFQQDVEQAKLSRIQSLSDLRQQLGYESVPTDFDVSGTFDYQPLLLTLDELEAKALQLRPDLRAAQLGVNAANSQHTLAEANGKQNIDVSGTYAHNGGISTVIAGISIPLPVFDRNQGEIARTTYAITQAREQFSAARGQVMTDVKDAWELMQSSDRVARFYQSGYLDISQRSRDISEYAYRRGASNLLDFLDAERTYRSTQLAWRQAVAAWLLAIEQVRQAVGTRVLP